MNYHCWNAHSIKSARVAYAETQLKTQAQVAQGTWDSHAKLWFIQYGRIKVPPLEKHILSDALGKLGNIKHQL
jgi:hypothetical protein